MYLQIFPSPGSVAGCHVWRCCGPLRDPPELQEIFYAACCAWGWSYEVWRDPGIFLDVGQSCCCCACRGPPVKIDLWRVEGGSLSTCSHLMKGTIFMINNEINLINDYYLPEIFIIQWWISYRNSSSLERQPTICINIFFFFFRNSFQTLGKIVSLKAKMCRGYHGWKVPFKKIFQYRLSADLRWGKVEFIPLLR